MQAWRSEVWHSAPAVTATPKAGQELLQFHPAEPEAVVQKARPRFVGRARRRHAVAVAPMAFACFSPWATWVFFRCALGERRGLPLARPPGLFQGRLQFLYPFSLGADRPVLFLAVLLELLERNRATTSSSSATRSARPTPPLPPDVAPSVVDIRAVRAASLVGQHRAPPPIRRSATRQMR